MRFIRSARFANRFDEGDAIARADAEHLLKARRMVVAGL